MKKSKIEISQNLKKVNLLVGITACNRLLYSKALLKSLHIFKDIYSEFINTKIIYVDNGTTEPGAKEYLDKCQTIDEVVYRPQRDPSNDEWKAKNEILNRLDKNSISLSRTQVLCFLQDDSQLVNPHAFASSIIDFALSNQNHQPIHAVRKVIVNSNVVFGAQHQVSPITNNKYWPLKNIHLNTTGLYKPDVFGIIGNYPIDLKQKTVDGFTSAEDVMSARAEKAGLLKVMFCPHTPSFASIWNDPRGMHALVRGENRIGYYAPPKDSDGLYYEMVSLEEHEKLVKKSNPISFTEMCKGIGWEYSKDSSGDLLKYDTKNNMDAIYRDGPVTLFDGTPSGPKEFIPEDKNSTVDNNPDYLEEWLSD